MKAKYANFAKKATALVLVGAVLTGSVFARPKKAKNVKIGVLVSDVSGEEALGFRAYYEKYIASAYNVTFKYTEQLTNAEEEKSAIEKFAAQGCKAIISLSSSDRVTQLQTCSDYKLYYAIASGMLEDDQYEQYKNNPYFVGQIGPSMETEFQAGLEMGRYFAAKGVKSVSIYGAFIPNPMHVYRTAGVLIGLGATYGGTNDKNAVVGQLFGDSRVNVAKISSPKVAIKSYFQGFGETTTDELNAAIQAKPDAFLSVGMATTFFTSQLNAAGIEFSDIDSFTSGNGKAMKDGKLVYLAGKYSSSIGPIFAAVINAVNGNSIRDKGNAISLSQNYLVAKNYADFDKFYTSDSGSSPIFDKSKLDSVIGSNVSYEAFKSLVENN